MDLETISKKIITHRYHNRHDFLVDVQQILENCILYNGKDSPYTEKAEMLVHTCKAALDEYDEHLTQLENKLALAEEKAIQDDENWMVNEDESFSLVDHDRVSQSSSPDHLSSIKSQLDDYDFVDVEDDITVDEISPEKKIKSEEPATLEQDLEFSSEDELDEVPLTEFEDDQKGLIISAELPGEGADDDSQQAAEAMVQLGSMGFYQQEESMDIDPNYDPSDFLMSGLTVVRKVEETMPRQGIKIHDDLAVSESEDEEISQEIQPDQENIQEEDDGVWF